MVSWIVKRYGPHGCLGLKNGKKAGRVTIHLYDNGKKLDISIRKLACFFLCGSYGQDEFDASHPCGDPFCGLHLIAETHETNTGRDHCHLKFESAEECRHVVKCLLPSVKNRFVEVPDNTLVFPGYSESFDNADSIHRDNHGKVDSLYLNGFYFKRMPRCNKNNLFCSRHTNNACRARIEVSETGFKVVIGEHCDDCKRIQEGKSRVDLHFENHGMRFKKGGSTGNVHIIDKRDNGRQCERYGKNKRCNNYGYVEGNRKQCNGRIMIREVQGQELAIRSNPHTLEKCKHLNVNVLNG